MRLRTLPSLACLKTLRKEQLGSRIALLAAARIRSGRGSTQVQAIKVRSEVVHLAETILRVVRVVVTISQVVATDRSLTLIYSRSSRKTWTDLIYHLRRSN